MLADTPIERDEDDRLGFGPLADALAELIDNPNTYTPLTVAISAPWGAGKTSLAKLVERRLIDWPLLRGETPHVVSWFNAWLHDDAPHLGAALAADIARTASGRRPFWRRLVGPLPSAMLSPEQRWRRRLKVAALATLAAVPVALLPDFRELFLDAGASEDELSFGASLTSAAAILGIGYAIWTKLFAIAQAAASFVDDPTSEAAKGSMSEVKAQVGKIVRQATCGNRKLVIFIDDLERCRPPRAVEVCEVASQLLGHRNVVTVLVADMNAVAAAAAIKYAALEGKYVAESSEASESDTLLVTYGRAYLEKLVQIEFALPPARHEGLKEMALR
jgi:KAP family P-loop domain